MKSFLCTLLLLGVLYDGYGQNNHKVHTYLSGQYNKTLQDITKGNNPWGLGLGVQCYFNPTQKWKPFIDVTADAYLENDKIYITNADGSEIRDVRGMVNILGGVAYRPAKKIFGSLAAGPGFVSEKVLLGVKPSLGFFFSENQKWTGRISYIHLFNRDTRSKEDFGSISFSMGCRIF